METPDDIYERLLKWKAEGGVALEVFVSDGIWLGGLHEASRHSPFVAIAPRDWDSEEEVTFFQNRKQVEKLIQQLRDACDRAFGSEE